jgi:biotin operon repressor
MSKNQNNYDYINEQNLLLVKTSPPMKKKPGLHKAIDFITQRIAAHEFDRYFPSIKTLAQAADVSFVTMWRAVDQLRKSGVLVQAGRKSRYAPGKIGTSAIRGNWDNVEPVG